MSAENQPADIAINLPELSMDNLETSTAQFYNYFINEFINGYSWTSLLIIVLAFIAGFIVRKLTMPVIVDKITKTSLSYRWRGSLTNISLLIFPFATLFFLSIGQAIQQTVLPEIDLTLILAITKLLVAWIFIRIASQIIDNGFIRSAVATGAWVIAALSILNVMDQTAATLNAIGMDFGDFRLSLLTIFKFVAALFILLTITNVMTRTSERFLNTNIDLTPSARVLLLKIIKITLITFAIIIGVTTAGIDLSALAIFGGALGLGLGFGLQKVTSNLFSGMLLLMDKSIKPGDIIELPGEQNTFGWVGQLGARYVSIITRDNKEYLIPNEDFITQPVINWSYTDRKIRIETKFGVAYNSDPHLVKKLAEETVLNIKRVVADPKPVCHLVEFGDYSLNFVLRYWIEDAENGVTNTKGAVMLALWDLFKEHNIEVPYPHHVIINNGKSS